MRWGGACGHGGELGGGQWSIGESVDHGHAAGVGECFEDTGLAADELTGGMWGGHAVQYFAILQNAQLSVRDCAALVGIAGPHPRGACGALAMAGNK